MVRIYDCSFCGHEIEPGTGTMLVTRDNVLRFDSRKCKRSHEMKRDPRKLKWTTKYQQRIITADVKAAATKSKGKEKPAKSSKDSKTDKKPKKDSKSKK